MLLSFSVPEMLPMIEAGLRQMAREDVGAETGQRVKRQTLRARGKCGAALLETAREAGWTIPYDLHLWWKSRTPERRLIGVIPHDRVRVYPVSIAHSIIVPGDESPDYPVVHMHGPRGWRKGDDALGDDQRALAVYQDFKDEFIAHLDGKTEFTVSLTAVTAVIDALEGRRARRTAASARAVA